MEVELVEKVTRALAHLKPGEELESSFPSGLSHDVFERVLTEAVRTYQCFDESLQLDVNYSDVDTHRCTLDGVEEVQRFVERYSAQDPSRLYASILTEVLEGEASDLVPFLFSEDKDPLRWSVYRKSRVQAFDSLQHGYRVRLSREEPLGKEQVASLLRDQADRGSTLLRLKHRVTVPVLEEDGFSLKIDLTAVRSARAVRRVTTSKLTYELELEAAASRPTSAEHSAAFVATMEALLRWVQGSAHLVTVAEKNKVLDVYCSLFKRNQMTRLYQMQPVTLEKAWVLPRLPHSYSVTDKADGSTVQLLLLDGEGYLLDVNLRVRKHLPRLASAQQGVSLLEGEEVGGSVLVYDALFVEGRDVRNQPGRQRAALAVEAVGQLSPAAAPVSTGEGVSPREFERHHREGVKRYYDHVRANPGLHTKYFIFPLGVDKREVFVGCKVLLEADSPYPRDGLIFTGVTEVYSSRTQVLQYPVLKWKPPSQNSVDFYLEFVKEVFGAGGARSMLGHLHVGREWGSGEVPVLFEEEQGLHRVFVPLDEKGVARDASGDRVRSKTVVEAVYDLLRKEWSVIRTREDKTLSVLNTRTRYGNYEDVARKIFQTILSPVEEGWLKELADKVPEQPQQQHQTQPPPGPEQQQPYYQLVSDVAKGLRNFHNHVKRTLIDLYGRRRVLDVGVGRGGDLGKYLANPSVDFLLGVDVDAGNLFAREDSAARRLQEAKNRRFPVHLAVADLSKPLQSSSKSSAENRTLVEKYLLDKEFTYHTVFFHFSIHYMFEEKRFKKLCSNLKGLLDKEDGTVVVTTFSPSAVEDYLGGEDGRRETYGSGETLFELRRVSFTGKVGFGQAIEFHTPMFMQSGVFYREYVVYPELLAKELKQQCGLALVDGGSFRDVMEQELEVLRNVDKLDPYARKLQEYLEDASTLGRASRVLSSMYSYYVFEKEGQRRRR